MAAYFGCWATVQSSHQHLNVSIHMAANTFSPSELAAGNREGMLTVSWDPNQHIQMKVKSSSVGFMCFTSLG